MGAPTAGGTNNDNRIIYQAAKGEKVVISGSEPVVGWEKVKNNTWKLIIANDYWEGTNPFDEQIYGSWYYGEGTPNHTGAVLLNGIPMGEAFSREEILKPIQGRARWYAETGGNGGPIVMNIGNVWPDGGKKVTPQQASVENGDQAVYVSNSCIQFGYLKDGSVIHYENVDFGEGAETLYLEIASLAKGGKVEMHMDNPDGELLGEYQMKSSTTDWLKFKEFPIKMNRLLVGRQNFCLVVRAVETDSCTPTIVWAQFPDGVNPNDGSVEIYVRPQVFYPEHTGVDYITVRGFILENAATNWAPPSAEQPALIGPRWAKGWVIENNVIRNSRCSGISLGRSTFGHAHHYQNMPPRVYVEPNGGQTVEQLKDYFENASWTKEEAGFHIVRYNHIYNCGQAGIVGCSGGAFSLIEENEIHDICQNETFWGFENAGIKLHFATDVVIRNNHIYRAYWGVWLDWGNSGAMVMNNLCHDNLKHDLFIEVCHGPITVANNIFLSKEGMNLPSEGLAIAHNLINGDITVRGDVRHTYFYKPHSTVSAGKVLNTGGDQRWYNNLFVGKASLGNWKKNSLILPMWYGGNVFTQGTHGADVDMDALTDRVFDPGIDLKEKEDGWHLRMKTSVEWRNAVKRKLVHTGMLGKAIIPQQNFTLPDGENLKIDKDFFGNRRKLSNPFPGPIEVSKGTLEWLLCPKRFYSEASL